ncbi:MAG: hypothetical protein U0935_16360 [Pirellulales bacterium]
MTFAPASGKGVASCVVNLRQVRCFAAPLLGILAGAAATLNNHGVSLEVVGDRE